MSDRIEMTIKMQVTVPQALALQAMLEHWNWLGAVGSSRDIGFFVDGDGNFKPKCEMSFSMPIPELTEEMRKRAVVREDRSGNKVFDFDPIAWMLRGPAPEGESPLSKAIKAARGGDAPPPDKIGFA